MTAMPLPETSNTALYSAEAFRLRARARLSVEPLKQSLSAPQAAAATAPSDFDLNPGLQEQIGAGAAAKPAAVLIPIIARLPLTVLFTQRTAHLAQHAGQVSFPGGKIDADDENAQATALREAHEEIALDPAAVEPIGFLDTYRTSTGFAVAPLVALVDASYQARPNPHEVDDIFEVPLAFLMEKDNIALNARMWLGKERHFYAYTFGARYIWGATAGMLNNMRERLF